MAEASSERRCSSFHLPKDTFNDIPISTSEDLKSITVFSQHWREILGVINKKDHVVELIAAMKIGEKPPCCLFVGRWKQSHVQEFVFLGIDSVHKSELLCSPSERLPF